MSTRKPWMKFFCADWRAHTKLRICSLTARGLWIEMICIMHEADPYGYLALNGKEVGLDKLADLTGGRLSELPTLLDELETAGVFSRTRNGTIYSRRMVRDEKKSKVSRKNGRLGGNPNLSKETGNSGWDNPGEKGGLKTHKPEARGQRPDSKSLPSPTESNSAAPWPENTDSVVDGFLRLREESFPNDSRLPSDRSALLTQAASWLKLGLPCEDMGAAMERGMVSYQAKGDGPPRSLEGFRLSFQDALVSHRLRRGEDLPPPSRYDWQDTDQFKADWADYEKLRDQVMGAPRDKGLSQRLRERQKYMLDTYPQTPERMVQPWR